MTNNSIDILVGDFTSCGFDSNGFICNGYSRHFNSEQQLRDYIKSWIMQAIVFLRSVNPIYKRQKTYEFYLGENTYYFTFPPFNSTVDKKKRIEASETYIERNRDLILTQINKIVENFRMDSVAFIQVQLTDNIFLNSQTYLISDDFATVFDDKKAFALCEKISTPFIRTLLKNPLANRVALHKIAMRCYNKYGGHVVTFILKLPKLSFGNKYAKPVVNKEEYSGQIPSLKIKFEKYVSEFYLCFYEPIINNKRKTRVATIYNKLNKKIEGFITYSGFIEHKINNESLGLKLFLDNIYNSSTITCSVEYGQCLHCGKELEDPISLKAGYGKCCAVKLGVPYN